ncbi:MAG: putative FmdB family regulatory protein [Myxococcota bacterium]|jgi:putative FmdB family regulatory protein
MPIYEYRCPECGHRFEKLVRMNATAPPCPECDHADVTKLVSASGFILKGGGWYKDHYGLKSSPKPDSGSSASDSGKEPSTPSTAAAPAESSSKGASAPAKPTTGGTDK